MYLSVMRLNSLAKEVPCQTQTALNEVISTRSELRKRSNLPNERNPIPRAAPQQPHSSRLDSYSPSFKTLSSPLLFLYC